MAILLPVLAAALAVVAAASSSESKKACKCNRTFKDRAHPRDVTHEYLPIEDGLPASLDWCERGMCTSSWNQHIPQYCGSCFAHGALSTANDRIKIMNHKKGFKGPDVMLGRQSFLNCAPGHGLSDGCGGGEPSDVFEFMRVYGLPDETCLPYNATDYSKYLNTSNGTCPPEGYCINCMYSPESPDKATCFPVKNVVRYRAQSYGRVVGEAAMIKELQRGPITCGIACSRQFDWNYTAGVFWDKTNFTEIDHDVEIVGYGEEDGVKYWHARNSWGTYWGENGFFKIVRGINNLAIESDCHYVVPDVSDEELVWDVKPAYGGSIYGIRPFNDAKLAKLHHKAQNTSDIAWNADPQSSHELDAPKDDGDVIVAPPKVEEDKPKIEETKPKVEEGKPKVEEGKVKEANLFAQEPVPVTTLSSTKTAFAFVGVGAIVVAAALLVAAKHRQSRYQHIA
ncbi:Aste57867_1903 [Aphanomyces stellatus]|uniref:Aste57867_1903 protein n=1 Tax=Aphanomyces stellatus TaxID=120398 RepID=A0A485K6V9_9STRA|nr:hypothetical protein As57867_001901 [Aphanomyces stellatus]VFT79110.1 Aste57867_1903 [Aphanomyces stellatus]